jgi:hypothetical protein
VTLCSPVYVHQCFKAAYCLHLQDRNWARNKHSFWLLTHPVSCLHFTGCLVNFSIMKMDAVLSSKTSANLHDVTSRCEKLKGNQAIRLSRVLFDDLTVIRLSRNSPLFTEPKRSLPFSQQLHQWTITWARQIQSALLRTKEPGQCIRYSDWLRGGQPRDRSSSPGRVKNFLFSTSPRPALGSTQPPIKWVPGVKRAEREADHSPPASVEVKKMWIYTSTSPYAFMA